MDRQAILGYILIFVLLVVWMWMNSPSPVERAQQSIRQDSSLVQDTAAARPAKLPQQDKIVAQADPFGKFFSHRISGREQTLTIESDLFIAELSTKGGLLKRWELKKYTTWDGQPAQLVEY